MDVPILVRSRIGNYLSGYVLVHKHSFLIRILPVVKEVAISQNAKCYSVSSNSERIFPKTKSFINPLSLVS